MSLYVHITDQCQHEAKKYNTQRLVEKISHSIENTQKMIGFNDYGRFAVKGLGRTFRLVAYRWDSEQDDELVIFCSILKRASRDYQVFINYDYSDEIIRRFVPYNNTELQQIYNDCKRISPIPPPPKPTDEEQAWLYQVLDKEHSENELLVLETESWVKKMRRPENREFLILYHQILEEMVDLSNLHAASTNIEYAVQREKGKGKKNGLGICYLYRPDLKRLLLIEPLDHDVDSDNVVQKHLERLKKLDSSQRALSRLSARSYPLYMVLERNYWLAIQKDEKTNIALSPEEVELLASIRHPGYGGQGGFPLFINGRAGSGKSTMLQYLAADYIDWALCHKLSTYLPIYITYSEDLLTHARDVVKALLTVHHERLLKSSHDAYDASAVDMMLDKTFVVFRDFLLSLLPLQIQQKLPQERYVNYARFCRLWTSEFVRVPGAKRLSPDIAWHILRCYIKGIRSGINDELLPEEFNRLPRDRKRSVLTETYHQVYEYVWNSWYKKLCKEKSYWDDQDLAAYVLEVGLTEENARAAIFCDEAQDFTSVELDIIFQLSLFGRRSLHPEELCRVPIVFAGDQLQTINPTGFRWQDIKAEFHNRFHAVLATRKQSPVEMKETSLNFNYRSKPGVVGFSNLIQLVRAALFSNNDIQLQETWWVDSPVQPVWFYWDTPYVKQKLQERPDITKLVNCEEGEETEYVDRDEILKDLAEKTEGVYREVWSPIRAKGLEFPDVILYRFGETVPDLETFSKMLDDPEGVDLSIPEKRLPYEYFFNRLYVAATRAKNQLIIIDSKEAIEKFWRFATDIEVSERLKRHLQRKNNAKYLTTFMTEGHEQAWSGERVNPNERGREYEEEGRRKLDPYMMRQAAIAYSSANNEYQASICLALAAEFEDQLQLAGDRYQALECYDDAFRCYWKGSCWPQLQNLAWCRSSLENMAADFMISRSLNQGFIKKLTDVSHPKNSERLAEMSRDTTWRKVWNALAEHLSKSLDDETLPWPSLYDIFKQLKQIGIPIKDEYLAGLAYKFGKYKEAIGLWERSKSAARKEYMHARAMTTPFPGNLVWLHRIGDNVEVLNQCRIHHSELQAIEFLDKQVVYAIVDAVLAEKRDLLIAEMVLKRHSDEELAAKLLRTAIELDNFSVAIEMVGILARIFFRQGRWQDAIRAVDEGIFDALPRKCNRKLRNILDDTARNKILPVVVEELAKSEKLSREEPEHKESVFQFLHRHIDVIKKAEPKGEQDQSLEEMLGFAIERTGKFWEALQYYTYNQVRISTTRIARILENLLKFGDAHTVTQAAEILVPFCLDMDDYKAALRLVEEGRFLGLSEELNEKLGQFLQATEGRIKLFHLLVQKLAVSKTLPHAKMQHKEMISEFLHRHFIKGGQAKRTTCYDISPEVIGAAIERAGKIIDALEYYDCLVKHSRGDFSIERFAAERYVHNLERYAKYLRKKGDEDYARDRYSLALEKRKHWKLGDEHFSEYPILDRRSTLPEVNKWERGPFCFELSKSHGKLVIQHIKRFEMVSVNVNKRKLLGDAEYSELEVSDKDCAAWQIKHWNTVIKLLFQKGSSRRIVIFWHDEIIETVTL